MTIAAFFAGMFVGAIVGVMAFAICQAAKAADKRDGVDG